MRSMASSLERLAIAIAIVSSAATVAFAQDTIMVPEQAGTIQAGINMAEDGQTVSISAGTYTDSGNRDIVLNGRNIIVQARNNGGPVIIDVEGPFTSGDGHRGVSFINGDTSQFIGITIRNGHMRGDRDGAGIRISESSPSIYSCVIEDCQAEGRGGGVYVLDHSGATFNDCEILSNRAGGTGSGVGNGGGIACFDTSFILLTECTISGNTADNDGAGIWGTSAAEIFAIDCTISGNACTVAGSGGSGGALYLKGTNSIAAISHCFIFGNQSAPGTAGQTQSKGGALLVDQALVTLKNCVLNDNLATSASALGGGAHVSNEGDLVVLSSTIYNNTATGSAGGAFYVTGNNQTNLAVRNSILWENDVNGGGTANQISSAGAAIVAVTTSCVELGGTTDGNINSDPGLSADGAGLVYLITSSSPCLNKGDNFFVDWNHDLNGNPRILNSVTEIGADEVYY